MGKSQASNRETKTKQSPTTALKRAWNCPWYRQFPYEDWRFVSQLLLLLPCFGKLDETIQSVISLQRNVFHFIPSQHLFVNLEASEGPPFKIIIRETHTASGFVLQALLPHTSDVCRCVCFYTLKAAVLRGIARTEKNNPMMPLCQKSLRCNYDCMFNHWCRTNNNMNAATLTLALMDRWRPHKQVQVCSGRQLLHQSPQGASL